jgi:hypothetical protein
VLIVVHDDFSGLLNVTQGLLIPVNYFCRAATTILAAGQG